VKVSPRPATIAWALAAAFGFLHAPPASADLELNRVVGVPGEVSIELPPYQGARRARLRLDMQPQSRVSVLGTWLPADRSLTVRLESQGSDGVLRPFASTAGMSPIVLGSLTDTTGRYWLILEAPEGRDTIRVALQVNWTAGTAARPAASTASVTPAVSDRFAETGVPSRSSTARNAESPGGLCRVIEISWREGGEIARGTLSREGLRMRLSGPINPEMLQSAITVEVGLPGSQEGLTRYEEAEVSITSVRAEGDWIILVLPPKLVLGKGSIVRVTLDGYRLLSRDGTMLDGDGSGLALPSGDGRPGGSFRSWMKIR
jgi:hypothetical protein